MWEIWKDISAELGWKVPFYPMVSLNSDPLKNADLMKKMSSPMPYTVVSSNVQEIALVESARFSSHYDVRNQIMGNGNGISLSFNVVSSPLGWIRSGEE